MQKFVNDNINNTTNTTDYLTGFQYKNAILDFFAHAEGYVKFNYGRVASPIFRFNYVFNYTDHLGNIRVSYSKDPSTKVLKILEENHYYPFGLKHTNYNSDKLMFIKEEEFYRIRPVAGAVQTYKYRYGGKEYQDELGLNMYDFGSRNYDASLGRWMNVDPLAEMSRRWTPYNYCYNNPIIFIDPDGMLSKSFGDEEFIDWKEENNTRNTLGESGEDNSYLGKENEWHKDKNGNLVPDKGDTIINCDNFVLNFNGKEWFVSDYQIEEVVIIGNVIKKGDSGNKLSPKEVRSQALEPNLGKIAEVTSNSLTVFEGARNSKLGDLIRGNGLKSTGVSSALKVGGRALGGVALLNTFAQFNSGKISGTEATVDAIFGAVGFIGPIGAGISLTYSLAKTGYELYTGETLFNKPTPTN